MELCPVRYPSNLLFGPEPGMSQRIVNNIQIYARDARTSTRPNHTQICVVMVKPEKAAKMYTFETNEGRKANYMPGMSEDGVGWCRIVADIIRSWRLRDVGGCQNKITEIWYSPLSQFPACCKGGILSAREIQQTTEFADKKLTEYVRKSEVRSHPAAHPPLRQMDHLHPMRSGGWLPESSNPAEDTAWGGTCILLSNSQNDR
ncbi:hypothetical protein B0H11DRAFT_1898169 [Mycena galericulata]|nr:hypothetical protein B0H11DRAFT_1898169 [Mycena galericulata]